MNSPATAPTKRRSSLPGLLFVIAFVALPTAIWFVLYPPLATDLSSFPLAAGYLGKTASIPGAALFTLSLILAARLPVYEKLFGDLPASYRAHQRIGGIAMILLSIHPLGLAFSYAAASPKFAIIFLMPTGALEKTLGIIALLLLQASLALTYWNRVPYRLWKLIHKVLGAAFLLGFIHALTIPGAMSSMPLLRAVLAVYVGLGITAWVYRSLAHRWLVQRTGYVVKAIRNLGARYVELDLEPTDKGIVFRPGQFVFVTVNDGSLPNEEHPFSISGTYGDGGLALTIKALGDFTAKMMRIKPGVKMLIEGPFGGFDYRTGGKRQVWIAGGIGITPFIGMAETLPDDYDVDLYYSVPTERDAVAKDALDTICGQKRCIRAIYWVSADKGRIAAETIAARSGKLADLDFFLCGPAPMILDIRRQLVSVGVRKDKIHQELFNLR